MSNFHSLPIDMQQEVKKLCQEHTVTLEVAYDYYMMGGYEQGNSLCSLRDMGYSDKFVKMTNQEIWNLKNEAILKEMIKYEDIKL